MFLVLFCDERDKIVKQSIFTKSKNTSITHGKSLQNTKSDSKIINKKNKCKNKCINKLRNAYAMTLLKPLLKTNLCKIENAQSMQ